jgi:hypothetical protein
MQVGALKIGETIAHSLDAIYAIDQTMPSKY